MAITGASGENTSAEPVIIPANASSEERQRLLSDAASEYMSYGQYGPSAINYEYWEPDNITSDTPLVEISYSSTRSSVIDGIVRIKNMPLLAENLSWVVGGATEANPTGKATTFNHARIYLENDEWY